MDEICSWQNIFSRIYRKAVIIRRLLRWRKIRWAFLHKHHKNWFGKNDVAVHLHNSISVHSQRLYSSQNLLCPDFYSTPENNPIDLTPPSNENSIECKPAIYTSSTLIPKDGVRPGTIVYFIYKPLGRKLYAYC